MPLVDLLNTLLWAGRKGPATYTRYFALGMQLSPALQSPFSFHLGCGYPRKKNEMEAKWNLETFGKRKSEKEMETKNAPIAGAVLSSRTIE